MTKSLLQKMQAGGAIGAWWRRIPADRRRSLIVTNVAILLLLFPLIDRNEGDVDAAANATAFAVLALGLNIVVGFAGLLDLGYAAFFAIGAYTYGILSSWQVQPQWSEFWEPFQWLGFVARFHADGVPDVVHFTVSFWIAMPICGVVAAFFGVVFGAPTLRLRGDYLAIVTLGFGEIVPIVARNTPLSHEWRHRPQRRGPAAPLRLFLRRRVQPLLLSRPADDRASGLRQPAAAEFAGGARLDGHPRG